MIVLYVASQNSLYLISALAAGTLAAVVAWRLFSHVQVRVLAWQDPWSTIDNEGYQVARSLFAIGTGGWFGMGLGEGMPNSIRWHPVILFFRQSARSWVLFLQSV